MAKIVVFSDAISENAPRTHFARQIVNHAAETANEIYFVTGDDREAELLGYHPKVQILRAFRHWNVLEAARLLPILMQLKADIFHFVQPQKKIGWNHAFPVLATFARSLNTKNVLSLIDFETKIPRGIQTMIATSQIVSVIDPSQSDSIRSIFRYLDIELLPARATLSEMTIGLDTTLEDDPNQFYIFLPENLNQYSESAEVIKILVSEMTSRPQLTVICAGSLIDFNIQTRRKILQSFGESASRVRWTGPLSPRSKISYLKNASVVILSGLAASPHLIHENLGMCLAAQAVVLLTSEQVKVSQMPIQNEVHAKVRELSDIAKALSEVLDFEPVRAELRKNLAELRQSHTEDELGNKLSRIYSKLLS